jgi:hypothetical protein
MFGKWVCFISVVLVLGVALSVPVGAEQFLVEHFDYTNGADLDGQVAGQGAWVTGGTDYAVLNDDGSGDGGTSSLQYPGLTDSQGGRLIPAGDCDFFLTTPVVGEGSVVYLSLLCKPTAILSGYFLRFATNGSVQGSLGRLRGRSAGDQQEFGVSIRSNSFSGYSDKTVALGETALVVFKLTMVPGADNDFVELWVNPPVGRPEPPADAVSSPDAGNDVNPATGILGFRFRDSGAGESKEVDEIRFGTTWEDVAGSVSKEAASAPSPGEEAADLPRQVVLDWTPGEDADTHSVYLGTVFEDVNTATTAEPLGVLVSQAQDANAFDAGVLTFGQSYFWRIDGISAAPDHTVFRGDVWSFSVEPFSYPIETITAQASSSHEPNTGPENTISGRGLNAIDQHSTVDTDMWLSGAGDPSVWIKYEFDRIYKLHEMWVWNSNQMIESFVGLGAKEVSIETSIDGDNWTKIEGTNQFTQATGSADYTHNTVVDFAGAQARYCRITIHSGYGMVSQYGLSEVRFFYVPTFARDPQPVPGTTDVSVVDVVLGWRAGREAATHRISLGTDPEAVAQGADPIDTSDTLYHPDALDLATSYHWQVIEVNEIEDPAAHAGDIWSFSTQDVLVVDDFEQYDDNCNRIFFAWSDGLGHTGSEGIEGCTVSPFNGNGSGSIVGNAQAPFAEISIVHSGGKSMPLIYDGASETTRMLTPAQDWTRHSIKGLVLWFAGDPANTGSELYVKINNTKLVYDGPADSLMLKPWQMWYIDLQNLSGANLTNVTELAIGLTGGQGMVYIDDIMLSPRDRQVVTPIDPDPAGLLAHYAFDGNANDSVGGLHGSLFENAEFAPGQQGQALSLNTVTVTDYAEITGYKGILGTNAFSMSLWIKTAETIEQQIVYYGTHSGGQRVEFRIHTNGHIRIGNGLGQVEGFTDVTDGSWHLVAVTVKENATNSSSDVRIYVDGRDDTQESADPDVYDLVADWDVTIGYRPSQNDRFFIGQIDEFYVYDRVLSRAEIAGLAGMTEPFDVAVGTE